MIAQMDGNGSHTQKLFNALIDGFPDMIHSVDESGRLVYVNHTATELLGYPEEVLLTMNIRQLYPPEIMEAVEKGFREVKQSGGMRVESLFMAQDGSRIPVELRTMVIRDAQGKFAKTFTVSRDLRKLKEMQEDLIHAGRLAAVGELAAGVVHDLNNPLTTVILASNVMKKVADSPDTSPDQLRTQTYEYCEMINESAATMGALTTRLRDFVRGVKEKHTVVDLFDPIHDALFILTHRMRNANIVVKNTAVKAKYLTLGDRNQIQQIFLNLFANACDAMANTEVRELSVEIGPQQLDERSLWCCVVSDTGTGIPKELQQQVFKSFFTTKPRGKGTGLGLSITRSILKEHNGDVRLASEPGKGTTFSILLPVHTP